MKVFWHLGWPKTATTSFQSYCFPHLENVEYIGKPWVSKEIERSIFEILYADDPHFDPKHLEPICQLIDKTKKKSVLISNEGFLMPSANDLGITIPRLLKISPNPKIILTIRNQIDLLQSIYTAGGYSYGHMMMHNTKVKFGKYLTMDQWLNANLDMSGVASTHHKSFISLLDYEVVISYLENIVGQGNVFVIPYEWLSLDPEKLASEFSDIFGCTFPEINSAETKYFQNLTTRSYNKRLPAFYAKFIDRLSAKVLQEVPRYQTKMPAQHKKELQEYYRKGNALIAERFSLDLKQLGYAL